MLHRHLILSLPILIVTGPGALLAQTWTSELYDGARLEVDTTTNKPRLYSPDGAEVPLWDGVHQLRDGTTVTVREGVMVPNEQVLELRDQYPRKEGFVGEAELACQQLVRKACGFDDECSDAVVCAHARQLRQFADEELQERERPGFSARFIETPSQCREALQNEAYFKPCNKGQQGGKPTPCAELVTKVCGDGDQCATRAACRPAKDLLDREYKERLSSATPGTESPASGQCRQALQDNGFFAACSP
jgi:hypothetical protein